MVVYWWFEWGIMRVLYGEIFIWSDFVFSLCKFLFNENSIDLLIRIWFCDSLNCEEKYVCWWFDEVCKFIRDCNEVVFIIKRIVGERWF